MTARPPNSLEALAGTTLASAAEDQPANILVVDDVEANRDALARRLERKGYTVTVAEDGLAALDKLATGSFDLVLLDVMMPRMSGLEALDRVRQTRSAAELPIIMATAKSDSGDVIDALKRGANDYVVKPLDFPVVLARVRTHLAAARSIRRILELEQSLAERNAALEAANAQLLAEADRTKRELAAAARVQESILPTTLPKVDRLSFAWQFRPCTELAGDALNVCPLTPTKTAAFVLDVTGHGVPAALAAVAAARFMSAPAANPASILVRPDGSPADAPEVASALDARFPWDDATGQFLTLYYTIVDTEAGTVSYIAAGHPAAVIVGRDSPPRYLEGTGMPIGLNDTYTPHVVPFKPGDRLYLYTDGITEAMNAAKDQFGPRRLLESLHRGLTLTLDESVRQLYADIEAFAAGTPPADDASVLAVELG